MAAFPDAAVGPPASHPPATSLATQVGEWLHPVTGHRRRSETERRIQHRAGIVGLVAMITGAGALAASLIAIQLSGLDPVPQDEQFGEILLPAAVLLVAISVFAPQSVFRTRSAARTREILTNPSAAIRPWTSTTVVFDAVLVGALLAGIYFNGILALAMFGLAFVVRIVFQSSRNITADPNARFHALVSAWTAAVTGAVAFVIVKPLIGSIDDPAPLWPLLFAAIAAMFVGLGMSALLRWVNCDRRRWSFVRDAIDPRRIIVALVSALIAWLVSWTGITVDAVLATGSPVAGTLAGLAVFIAAWLALWYVSIRFWYRDAYRTMDLWSAHQAEVIGRLADGSLSPELAERAAVRVTSRMAISVFGATRAMTVLADARIEPVVDVVSVAMHDNAPPVEARSIAALPHLRMPLYPSPSHPSTSGVTVAGWLWPGWLLTRSRRLVQRFTDLATQTLLTPLAASDDSRLAGAFEEMFTPVSRWPSLAAYEEAVQRMRERADASPQSTSLLVAVYAIDDFGALAGGKFEQVAVGQVMRLALGHQEFAGHDVFVAYEEPGRLWVALGSGPIIRNGIELLRGLQQYINDHGSVPSAKLDVDVHVSVSFGYAAHQVDDFAYDGLMATARHRLATDQAARDPFTIDNALSLDFSPEDIIDTPTVPITAVDVVSLLRDDSVAQERDGAPRFSTVVAPIMNVDSQEVVGLATTVGWRRTVGSLDASDPEAFRSMISRQVDIAAQGTRAILREVRTLLEETAQAQRSHLPVMAWMPSVLLTAEAAQVALPNLVTPYMDRAACARTVVLLDTIPLGSGQALRLLNDRGVNIAVTAGAAAAADPSDLYGWQRWAVLFPPHVVQGPHGVDSLTIQQTISAIANVTTHLIAVTNGTIDMRELAANNIHWTLDPSSGIAVDLDGALRSGLLD